MEYGDPDWAYIFKAPTAIKIETTPRSKQSPAKLPKNFHRTLSEVWVEHEIEGWITKIRLHKNGECIADRKECTRRWNRAETHG